MLTPDKMGLLSDIMDNMKRYALNQAKRMPENWDGHEIRAWLADEFERERTQLMRDKRSARVRDYKNEVLTRNI